MIRGITLYQPMAWAIAAGHKRIENRRWKPWGGVTHLAVHAGQKYDRRYVDFIEGLGVAVPERAELVFGAVIAVARLAGYVEVSSDPWFTGPYGWLLADVVAVEPIACPGALGLWQLPQAVLERVRGLASKKKPV